MATRRDGLRKCTTCGRPASNRYRNAAAGEKCVDVIHDPFLTAEQRAESKRIRKRIAAKRD